MSGNSRLNDALMRSRTILGWDSIIDYAGGGLLLELGVWGGDSFKEICRHANPRKVFGFDWFHGLPEEWDDYPTGRPNQHDEMSRNGEPPECPENGEFVVGLIQDTLPKFMEGHNKWPVAFAHFDLDLYSSTKAGLEILSPHFHCGTILAFDEIDGAVRNANHEQKAFREWIDKTSYDVQLLGQRHSESWVIRLT